MNKIYELKGRFSHNNKGTFPGMPSLPKKDNPIVDLKKISQILNELKFLSSFWGKNEYINEALVQVNYDRVLAKSNRINILLSESLTEEMNKKIVGAKYRKENTIKHSIIYCVNRDAIDESISLLDKCANIMEKEFNSVINQDKLDSITSNDLRLHSKISKSRFIHIIVELYYIESFSLPDYMPETQLKEVVTTFYNTSNNLYDLFLKLGFEPNKLPVKISDNTYLLSNNQYNTVINKAPYLVSSGLENISDIKVDKEISKYEKPPTIPKPTNEPYIGVLDWPFNRNVYFSDWVDYKNETGLSDDMFFEDDYFHGTRVDSIIVDGPANNQALEDGCGRFRVKHFGIAYGDHVSIKDAVERIRKVISENSNIKVWNLSLGSKNEINENYISPIASLLDELQYKYDVIFIVSGTNDDNCSLKMRVGDPADSINSIVVNSISLKNKIANYSRKGPVLSFYEKPDICYYGGDLDDPITVWDAKGKAYVRGTSFAAPWITRKVAYLIYIMGMSKEIAKALIIDSSLSWEKSDLPSEFYGHGIVPKRIEDILSSKNEEIRFYINETASQYDNFSYRIPIPIHNDKFPYISRATLCYFTKCSRNQGVDYNDVELDLHFGRYDGKGIKTINDNKQNDDGVGFVDEENARRMFRKWDNVKIVSERFSSRKSEKSILNNNYWGLSIKKTGRFREPNQDNINYGVVVTLKEIKGINRIQEFIRLCNINGWQCNEIDIVNMNKIYVDSEGEIQLK